MATKTRQLADFLQEGGVQDIAVQQNPHIQPGTLQPAVAGKLLDGTTNHSGAYGTAQSDGHKYYYTDIKGSKPIKDPRIGAHFGSQRHKIKSIQLLEQETASHGRNVYSADGREWFRVVDLSAAQSLYIIKSTGGYGTSTYQSDNAFYEVTGYFNNFNVQVRCLANRVDDVNVTINGGTTRNSSNTDLMGGKTTATNPMEGRHVDAGSLINHNDSNVTSDLGTAPAINTLRFEPVITSGEYFQLFAIELIAQDTSSTANRSKIQIPAQTVVSYGKKFSVSAAAPHYDPFNGFTNSSGNAAGLHSTYVDTATSLGLDSAPGSSAKWAISSTNNIRPYNGGRVVKWIASDGTIKTSVTMMPPNAQNIKTTASNEITTPSATNTTTTPNMSDDAVDHSLSEVAKTYHWREFGNGAANTGGYVDYYADATMLKDVVDDIGYVMDDGLTSLVGNDVRAASDQDLRPEDDAGDDFWASTFIGTGVSIKTTTYAAGTYHIACNLPYGTHALKVERDADTTPDMYLDGLTYADVTEGPYSGETYGCLWEITFYQPKMPPIPEDACIIADYMLMADFVRQAAPTKSSAPWNEEHTLISKGVRVQGPSRDIHYEDVTGGFVFSFDIQNTGSGYYCASNSTSTNAGNNFWQLPAFGTDFVLNSHSQGIPDLYVNDVDVAQTETTGHTFHDMTYPNAVTTLGNNIWKVKPRNTNGDYAPYVGPKGFMIVSPTHTSSHYQTWETQETKELVGGDRNMEQHNLIVTPDGKSWDEVTRDTSYISRNHCVSLNEDADTNVNGYVKFTNVRGTVGTGNHMMNKDFALAYDRLICLVAGKYRMEWIASASDHSYIGGTLRVNNSTSSQQWNDTAQGRSKINLVSVVNLQRGDYVQATFENSNIEGSSQEYNIFSIVRMD